MVERRWLLRLVPPVAGALAVGMIAATSIGATDEAWDPPPCSGPAAEFDAAVHAPGPATPRALADEAWFAIDPLLDADGALNGQRLHVGVGSAPERFIDLPAESTAAGPFGRLVVLVADDGERSTVRAIDPAAGCARPLGESADVIRRATLDPGGTSVYEFRVDRRTRADLGVWRRPLDGSANTARVLAPIARDSAIGITFTTTLGWSAEGDRLVVQSCGAVRCRTRVLDPDSGAVDTLAGPDQGELVGVAGGRLVGYAACVGLPCPLIATDIASGDETVLEAAAGLARIVATADGSRVAIEAAGGDPPDTTVRVVRPDGSPDTTLEIRGRRLRLVPDGDRAAAGSRLPPGWIALSGDGRGRGGALLARLADGSTVGLAEVTR